jgi:flagellar biosynthesis/type III secretory pathway chaperone
MKTNIQWNQLIELLEAEIQHYGHLKDLIDTEAHALVQSDLQQFNRILNEKQALVEQVQRLEADRSRWIIQLGQSEGKISLKALIARAPREVSVRLDRCRRELVYLTHALEARNQLHKKMLNHSRSWAGNALRLLGGQLYVQPTYQASGHLSGAGKGGAVLSGIA